jgi:hypothetical protein
MNSRATTPKAPAPLNLAALVAPLPEVILPNGRTVPMAHLSADGFERFRGIQQMMRAADAGEPVDDAHADAEIDACLALALPTATRDDLASFGLRVELKLAVLAAAAGRVDTVLHAVAQAQAAIAGNGAGTTPTRPRRSSPNTTSARS